MQVIQVTQRYFPNIGGMEVVVQRISEMLTMKGASVTVYSVDYDHKLPRQQKINGVLIKRFKPLIGTPLYVPEMNFVKYIRKENANVVHIHNIHTLLPLLTSLLKHENQKLLLQPHYHRFGQTPTRHLFFNRYKQLFHILASRHIDCIVVNSSYEKKIFSEDFPECKNVVLIPEGIAVDELKRVRWSPEKPARILYVGALKRYKNVDKILKAFAKLVATRKGNFKLVIVGKGPEYLQLVDLAKGLRVEDLVEWKYDLSRYQLLSEYAKASVVVLFSLLESFSIVVNEALLIGIPTVVLNFGATANLVNAGLAIGVSSVDPDEIAVGILKAIGAARPQIRKNLGVFLSWDEYTDRILSTYRQVEG